MSPALRYIGNFLSVGNIKCWRENGYTLQTFVSRSLYYNNFNGLSNFICFYRIPYFFSFFIFCCCFIEPNSNQNTIELARCKKLRFFLFNFDCSINIITFIYLHRNLLSRINFSQINFWLSQYNSKYMINNTCIANELVSICAHKRAYIRTSAMWKKILLWTNKIWKTNIFKKKNANNPIHSS